MTLERLRGLPLQRVAEDLGYRRDPADGARWRRSGSILSISGSKFYDHLRGKGGGGAIDLVIHARGCGFREAVAFLGGGGRAIRAPADPVGGIRAYLRDRRALDPALVERCVRERLIESDGRGNAAFAMRDAGGGAAGAEIVGTRPGRPFKGLAKGSRKSLGGFWIARSPGIPRSALLVESAIDALSAFSLRSDADIVVSTAGVAASLPKWLDAPSFDSFICGYDADEAGDRAARALASSDARVERLRPDGAKDWNELLQRRRAGRE